MKYSIQYYLVPLLALATLLPATSIKLAVLRETPATPQTFRLSAAGHEFTLEEVDVGTLFDCYHGSIVGIVLKDSSGPPDGPTTWTMPLHISPGLGAMAPPPRVS